MTLPTAEIIPTLEAISSTPTGGAMACRFLQAKWFDLQKRFGKGSINFAKVISAITKFGANKFDYDEVNLIKFSLINLFKHFYSYVSAKIPCRSFWRRLGNAVIDDDSAYCRCKRRMDKQITQYYL